MNASFTDLLDLASEKVGGAAVLANDDFFAEKENLVHTGDPVWDEHRYTDKGKWMDGWESRRRRTPGHDWCIVRLGIPGIVRGVVVDTRFFRGNFPESASLEGCEIGESLDLDALTGPALAWTELVPRSPLQGDFQSSFPISSAKRFTHLRLNIFPDGGVARLRVHGEPAPDPARLAGAAGRVDLAAAANGAQVVVASDMFFGSRHNLILPGHAVKMSDGWETRRRRGPGNDWTIVRLGARGVVRRIEIDTTHFKGNAPGEASLEACDAPGATADSLTKIDWRPLLRRTRTQAHTFHRYQDEVRVLPPVTHVRLQVYPDGGVARLHLWGDPAETRPAALAKLDAMSKADAAAALLACCGSRAWAERMSTLRPFEDLASLLRLAERTWWETSEADRLEAFSAHPRIGEKKTSGWASEEQAGVSGAPEKTLADLAKKNAEYEKKFGFVYLVCATGKSADEMLALLEHRLAGDRASELRTASEEQAQITRIRLQKLVDA